MGVERGRPGVPERHVDVLHGVDPEAVAVGVVDQPFGRELQLVLYGGIVGLEIVEAEQLAQDLLGIDEVADVAVRVKLAEVVEHPRVALAGVAPAQRVAAGVPVGGIARIAAVDQIPHVIHDHVQDQVDPAGVAGRGQRLELRERSKVGGDGVEITRRIAVVFGVGVQHHRRDPDRAHAEVHEVVEPGLDPGEIAAVDLGAVGGRVISLDRVVRGIAVCEAVGDHLIDDHVSPVGGRCGRRARCAGAGG